MGILYFDGTGNKIFSSGSLIPVWTDTCDASVFYPCLNCKK